MSYQTWQSTYRQLSNQWRIEFLENETTHVSSKADCKHAAKQLSDRFNQWLNTPSFRSIRDRLFEKLSPADAIRLLIRTDDSQLRRLPWHVWDLLERYPRAEIALSPVSSETLPSAPLNQTVDILAILGDSTGIDLKQDEALLNQLPNARVQLLVEPKRQELGDQLWEKSWDILFFAGHSTTQGEQDVGYLKINADDRLALDDLKHALRVAIRKGLKLAIFNSCDGLGLARQLDDLHIPQMIVMSESVPDRVAQAFLNYFLKAYSDGHSLYMAVRMARERLEALEVQFPCATWLPVLCQNSADVPPMWDTLRASPSLPSRALQRGVGMVLLASFLMTALVLGVRRLGVLQAIELQTFDQLMRMRQEELPDSRLLIVGITEGDIQAQGQEPRKGTLSDKTLLRLLNKLEQYQPAAIGLDLYRDYPAGDKQLRDRLQQTQHLIAICKASDPAMNVPPILPPPEVSQERLGFSDFVLDPDGILRRQLLAIAPSPDSLCSTSDTFYAFSTQLAFVYLASQKIQLKTSPEGDLQIGTTLFKPLGRSTNAYQTVDLDGYQILLNYRAHRRSTDNFPQVTLTQVLSNQLNPALVKNRIVLIGVNNYSSGDFWSTPYSQGQSSHQQLPGVLIHAHMVSQILSAVLDHRPLIHTWADWKEWLWVWSFALLGGISGLCLRSPLYLGLTLLVGTAGLWGICLMLLTWGYWVPLASSMLASGLTSGAVYVSLAKKGDLKDLQNHQEVQP
ncbi:MAG: CHASE2 domain-containing protein [Leptolyngbya sp. BL-A-14]